MAGKVIAKLSKFGYEMTPAPAVQAFFYIERIDYGEWVDFLIDTGASGTSLHGPHAFDLQEYMRIETLDYSNGFGEIRVGYYYETAIILFWDENGKPLYQVVELAINQFTEDYMNNQNILDDCLECPCLLGRDILDKCTFLYQVNPEEITLTFR